MAVVRVFSGTHRCDVTARDIDEVTVDGPATLHHVAGTSTIDGVRGRITVHVPVGSDVVVGSTSGRISLRGRFDAVSVSSETGRVSVESAGSVDARGQSGRIDIGEVAGTCRVHSGSGRVEVTRCGHADVAATTSRIELGAVHGPARAHTVSGRITLTMAVAADVDAETVTGRIDVRLPTGTEVYRPPVGSTAVRPEGCDCTVRARSNTGKVEVTTR